MGGRAFLGVCLGVQLLAAALGARVYAAESPEVGLLDVELTPVGERLSLVELDRDLLGAALAHHLREDAGMLASDVLQDEDAHRGQGARSRSPFICSLSSTMSPLVASTRATARSA